VYNEQKDHLYGMFLTIPDDRLTRSSNSILSSRKNLREIRRPFMPDSIPARGLLDTLSLPRF